MQARCGRCQSVFSITSFGLQRCPSCATEVNIRDPNAPAAATPGFATGLPSSLDAAYAPPSTEVAPPPDAAAQVDAELLPWDRRAELGLVAALVGTVKLVLFEPSRAFARLHPEKRGGMLLYYALIGLVPTLVSLGVNAVLPKSDEDFAKMAQAEKVYAQMGLPPLVIESLLGMAFPTPETLPRTIALLLPFTAIMLVVALVWVHGVLFIMGKARNGWYASFKALLLSYTPGVLSVVPVLGQTVAGFWIIGLMVVGLARAHGVKKRWVVFGLFGVPVVLVFAFVLVYAFFAPRPMP